MVLQTCLLGCISIVRPIKRIITLTEPVSGVGSDIVDKLSFTNILTWRFYWMPNYFKYFDSSEMTSRPEARLRLPNNPIEQKVKQTEQMMQSTKKQSFTKNG